MANSIKKQIDGKLAIGIVILAFFTAFVVIILGYGNSIYKLLDSFPVLSDISLPGFISAPASEAEGVEAFSSEEDFKTYLQEGTIGQGYLALGGGIERVAMPEMTEMSAPLADGEEWKSSEPERISETTVQVVGIDEPDIVKTDGKEIYFSPGYIWRYNEPWAGRGIIPPQKGGTEIVKAFPPADLELVGDIDKSGNLLLNKNILTVFSGQEIYGYDVSNPESPKKKWNIKLENNNYLVEARLYQDKIYLVVKSRINTVHPCPIKPLTIEGSSLTVSCGEIYHPIASVPVDSTFVAMVLNPASGKIEKKVSFVGSSGSSVVYMSENGIYSTYSYNESIVKFFSNFLKEKGKDLFPNWLLKKLGNLESYDISQQAKLVELQIILEQYHNSLDDDERLKLENELSNRMSDYYKEHKRDLEKTGIIKIGLEKFNVEASGNVPGYPLNQFALDEYEGNLRIATTIGERWWGFMAGMGSGESANDVYVLDKDLKIQGQIKDLGLTEKIYSVRFIKDKGYVVTFRQIDPFYVLDLSNPKKPEVKGELKIPGYSSYLHPITEDKILGIGKEGWKVKISLFDVSSPEEPKEIGKYILDELWSDALSTHHAFLLDKKHNIFFLPGSKGGYIFSYENDELKLIKAVSRISARRAIYLDDYLYIIGNDKIVVLNETDWERVNELDL